VWGLGEVDAVEDESIYVYLTQEAIMEGADVFQFLNRNDVAGPFRIIACALVDRNVVSLLFFKCRVSWGVFIVFLVSVG